MRTSSGILAATAAALFLAGATGVVASPASAAEKIKCDGVNSCKGHSDCKTSSSECAAKNECKGKGFVMLTPEECEAAKAKMRTEEEQE
jgi:uncharacterized membrane protein